MSPHQTIAVAVRLFAIWLFLYFVRDTLSFFYDPQAHSRPDALAVALSVITVSGLVASALWFFPLTVARKLLTSPTSESAPPAQPDEWVAAGCVLLGLWVLSLAVPLFIRDALMGYLYRDSYGGPPMWPILLRYVVEIGIAIWLVCGAKGVRAIFRWARTVGVS
jgi:hypothetical protein